VSHEPTPAIIAGSQMTDFIRFCEADTGLRFLDHASFHHFSVDQFRRFWGLFLGWSALIHEGSAEPVCAGDVCETASFFPNVRLGYVENLLRIDAGLDGDRPALTSRDGAGRREQLTRRELRDRVASLSASLDALGVVPGDRIVAVAHNDASAVIAGLGVAAVGASLSTASPDMGAFSIVARFGQLEPSILMCHLRDLDPAAPSPLARRISEVVRGLPSLKAIIALDDGAVPPELGVPVHALSALMGGPTDVEGRGVWRRFPFNHPLFILFSSGTTGPPKCIIHGAGGTLLEHVKEHRLHGDIRPTDKLFFHTSCSWMMWNWQLSALASGAEIVLYSGTIGDPAVLWRVVSEEEVTAFGTSPAYLQMCEDAGFSPARELRLDRLRVLMSTGSILYDHAYDWARENVGQLPLQSISGGTDIIGCFVLGNPNLPVLRGENQCRSLGLDVQALRSDGATANATGELVCRNPFPSRPLGFYGDPGAERFHDAYFSQNPGVWTHGDLIEFSEDGAARIHGRSDSVLNVHGMRVGPAEIYRILQNLPEIQECLAVEQQVPDAPGQSRLVLLVVPRAGCALDGALKIRIRKELASRGSAAHVPELILSVTEVPVTHSGKRSERAARDAVNGVEAVNVGALRNPESLREIACALEEDRREAGTSRSSEDEALERVLTSAWEHAFDVAPLSLDDNFFALGGTSLLALRLCNDVRERTGWELPPSTLFAAPTIAGMAAAIRDGVTKPLSPVVLLNDCVRGRPLFIVHGLAGDVLELRALAQLLRGDRPVIGLRARGLDPRSRAHQTVEEMAGAYVQHVRRQQPEGRYLLAGYSFGGLVAFEMARLLEQAGERVEFLGLLDANVHHGCLPPIERWRFRVLRKLHHATLHLPRPGSRVLLAGRDAVRAFVESRLHATCSEASGDALRTKQLTPIMAHLEELAWRAFAAYRPKPYTGAVTFFRAAARPPDYCYPIPIWAEMTGGRLSICDVSGDHFSMIRPPHVDVLARSLADRMRSAHAHE